jgi:hypothetical protein
VVAILILFWSFLFSVRGVMFKSKYVPGDSD